MRLPILPEMETAPTAPRAQQAAPLQRWVMRPTWERAQQAAPRQRARRGRGRRREAVAVSAGIPESVAVFAENLTPGPSPARRGEAREVADSAGIPVSVADSAGIPV